jgi:CRISPR/Cas system-associated endoribonuclease Cas2
MAQIDPNIALGFRMPQIQDPLVATARAQEIGVNALKMNELQRGLQEEQEIRNYLAGADLTKPETRAALTKFGKSGLAYGKALAEQEKAGLETKKLRGDIDKQALEQSRERTSNLAFNPSNENILAHLQDSVLRGEMNDAQAQGLWAQVKDLNPDQRKQTFLQLGANAAKRLEQMTISAAQQQTANVTMRGQDISAQTAMRGQDIGRIPVGYRQTDTGAIEPIPGGPTTTTLSPKEIQAREAKFPQANLAVKSFESKSDTVLKDIERLRNHPGLSSITGIVAGRAPGVTAAGREALELYEKVVAGLQFKELQDMRNASPTGGALGNVSNQEGTQLRQAAGALSRVQEKGSVQNELDRIADSIRGSKSRVREAFDLTYDYKPSVSGGAAPSAAPAAGGKKDDPLGIR